MSRKVSVNLPYKFCYICGRYATEKERREITKSFKVNYWNYFGIQLSNLDKTWVPQSVCTSCVSALSSWSKNGKNMLFSAPTTWREPRSHDESYFCLCKDGGFSVKSKDLIKYPDVSSVTKSVPFKGVVMLFRLYHKMLKETTITITMMLIMMMILIMITTHMTYLLWK